MSSTYQKVQKLYEAGRVKRMHTRSVVKEQTVGQHTYGGLILVLELCQTSPVPVSTLSVMQAMLYHDSPEVDTGDIPAPTKWKNRVITEQLMLMEDDFNSEWKLFVTLTPAEQEILKLADTLDLAFYCLHERQLGNRTPQIQEIMHNCIRIASTSKHPGALYFVNLLNADWRAV